jgi:tetratricopeptide (TPR) repeat protein
MRKLLVLLVLMLAACGSQSRDDYVDDVWDTYDPGRDRPTYDERYVPPSRMNADQLVERAMRAERDGRDDQARVDYHAAFRRDRWHAEANRRYQDLMLRNGLFDTVWQEYLDLWQAEPGRGDALWFHLRPMLLRRADQPMPLEREPKLSPEQAERVNALSAEARSKWNDGDDAGAREAVKQALEIADLAELHRLRILLAPAEEHAALLTEYAERAEENPASGDNLYLHARVLAYRDVAAALGMLRGGWILDLPGWWLRFGIGEFARGLGDNQLTAALEGDQQAQRSTQGWYATAEAFLTACKEVRPSDPETNEQLGWITTQRNRIE